MRLLQYILIIILIIFILSLGYFGYKIHKFGKQLENIISTNIFKNFIKK